MTQGSGKEEKDRISGCQFMDLGRHDEIILGEPPNRVGAKLDAELLVSGQV